MVAYILSLPQIFEMSFNARGLMPLAFGIRGGGTGVASLLNARFISWLGLPAISHGALLAFIVATAAHVLVLLSGHENITGFDLFLSLTMAGFAVANSNFGAMALAPVLGVVGLSASVQGVMSTPGGHAVGAAIGQRFDGGPRPFLIGCLGCGLSALVAVAAAERGHLFGSSLALPT